MSLQQHNVDAAFISPSGFLYTYVYYWMGWLLVKVMAFAAIMVVVTWFFHKSATSECPSSSTFCIEYQQHYEWKQGKQLNEHSRKGRIVCKWNESLFISTFVVILAFILNDNGACGHTKNRCKKNIIFYLHIDWFLLWIFKHTSL